MINEKLLQLKTVSVNNKNILLAAFQNYNWFTFKRTSCVMVKTDLNYGNNNNDVILQISTEGTIGQMIYFDGFIACVVYQQTPNGAMSDVTISKISDQNFGDKGNKCLDI